MPNPNYESAAGVVDGANLVFTVTPYSAGSLAVFLNGQLLKNSAGDPWIETSPEAGTFTLAVDCVPRTGDQVAAFFLDREPTEGERIIELVAMLESDDISTEVAPSRIDVVFSSDELQSKVSEDEIGTEVKLDEISVDLRSC